MIVRGKIVLTAPGDSNAEILSNAAVRIQGERISEVAPWSDLHARYPREEVIGDGTQLLMPGFVDAHSHARGLSPLRAGLGYDYLELWLPQTAYLPNPGSYLNALYSGVRHIHSGFTAMHYLPIPRIPLEELKSDIDQGVSALKSTGIRVAFSVSIKDQNLISYDDDAFLSYLPCHLRNSVKKVSHDEQRAIRREFAELFSDFFAAYNTACSPVLLGPAGPQWCSDSLLETVARLAEEHDTRIHLHALQTVYQKAYAERVFRESLIEHLESLRLLSPRLTLGHAVWLDDVDIDRLAERKVSVTHHLGCNLNMRNGIAPVGAYLRRGVRVAMGLDDKPFSENEDAFQEMRLIALLHRGQSPAFTRESLHSWDVLSMATEQAAWVIGLEGCCGRLEPGYCADMILVDLERVAKPFYASEVDLRDLLLYSGLASDVDTVIVGGRVVMRERKVLTVDEQALEREFCAAITSQMRITKGDNFPTELVGYLRDFYQDWGLSEGRNSR